MLHAIDKPTIVESGGRDPWVGVSVKPGHENTNIDFHFFPDNLHWTDLYEPEIGPIVFQRVKFGLSQ